MFTIKNLPEGWTIKRDGILFTHGWCFGYYEPSTKTVYLPYIPFFFNRQHEYGHVYGITECPNCIMYEGTGDERDTLREKIKAIPVVGKFLFKSGEIFCPTCIEHLKKEGAG